MITDAELTNLNQAKSESEFSKILVYIFGTLLLYDRNKEYLNAFLSCNACVFWTKISSAVIKGIV